MDKYIYNHVRIIEAFNTVFTIITENLSKMSFHAKLYNYFKATIIAVLKQSFGLIKGRQPLSKLYRLCLL